MTYLFDTHAWLWLLLEPDRVGKKARALVLDSRHVRAQLLKGNALAGLNKIDDAILDVDIDVTLPGVAIFARAWRSQGRASQYSQAERAGANQAMRIHLVLPSC